MTKYFNGLAEDQILKMDIEGQKCQLCGENVIPSAIGLWELPIYLKKFVPEYKVYFRHHDYIYSDIICYATA